MQYTKYMLIALVFFLLSCGTPEQNVNNSAMIDESGSEKENTAMDSTIDVQIVFQGRRMRKPPMVDLLLDVSLRNQGNEDRWFIMPSNVQSSLSFEQGIHTVQLYKTCGEGCLTLSKLLGQESYYALLLPPHAEMKIQGLPVTLWQDEDRITESIQIEIVVAEGINIEATPLRDWMDVEWISDSIAEVSYDSATDIIGAKHKPDLEAMPIKIAEVKRAEFTIQIGPE